MQAFFTPMIWNNIWKFILFPGLIFIISSCKQEKMLFYPETLPTDYKFTFKEEFEEHFFKVEEGVKLHGLLFHADSGKGLIFYLHGNAGSNRSWGEIAGVYLQNNYDFFILDYRGYGKSQGRIRSELQLYNDLNIVYDSLKQTYQESKIIITGYSIGTGLAAQLASVNDPKLLILKAPYYNMTDLIKHYFKIIPSFLIRYKFSTNEYIIKLKCPVIIFHGDKDEVIYHGSSLKLAKLFKKEDELIILEGQKHNGINNNKFYLEELKRILK